MIFRGRFVEPVLLCAGLLLAFLCLNAPAARAEFGIAPGTVMGKGHEPIPLAIIGLAGGSRALGLPGIIAAEPLSQAGSHPDATGGGIILPTNPAELTRELIVDTPPGFVFNPAAVPACSRTAFFETIAGERAKGCQPVSQVGVVTVENPAGPSAPGFPGGTFTQPVYRLTPSTGFPASLGFEALAGSGVVVNGNVRTDVDHGVSAGATEITTIGGNVRFAYLTIWGVPADPVHNPDRWNPVSLSWGAPSGNTRIPFTQLPADCSNGQLSVTAHIRSWQNPGLQLPDDLPVGDPRIPDYTIPVPQPTGCEVLNFKPSIALVPSAKDSDSPTGMSVQLDVPQNLDPDSLSTPPLKKAVVTMPEGMSFNPAAADGLEGCSEEQMGLTTTSGAYPNPIRFAKGDAGCPQASKLGTAVVKTPVLEELVTGDVYLARPFDNPFGTLGAIYLVLRGPGFVIKQAGKVESDPETGRLTATFDYSPQLPFDELDLNFFGGPRAPLATSPLCGPQPILSEFTPWSHPASGPPALPGNEYVADKGPAGAACSFSLASRPFSPALSAGTENPVAGGYSVLTMRLTRADGHQELAGLTVRPPLGFTAVLAGMPYCSEAQIAAAAASSGKAEAASPSCPSASRVGGVLTGAGAGPTPFFAAGDAYLSGPYKGAPLSLAVVVPALAGGSPGNPVFDLGTVVVRVALHINPVTAQITAISDPVPQVLRVPRPGGGLDGVPLRIKDIRVRMDRPEWGVNPTSCAEKSFGADAVGRSGASASLSNRFQALECANLDFAPRMSLKLNGGTRRAGHPSLRAEIRPRVGDANFTRAAVTLPRTALLDQAHIRTVCTRVQFAADSCPAGAVYGRARAFTPLLDQPLEGPVYLRSSSNLLPDLVADLRGPAHQPIRVELVGRVDSVKGGIRTTFETVPDAPVSKFVLTMQGGSKGLIFNGENLCTVTSRATVRLLGQNGRRHDFSPKVVPTACAKSRKKRNAKRRKARRAARTAAKTPSRRPGR